MFDGVYGVFLFVSSFFKDMFIRFDVVECFSECHFGVDFGNRMFY